MKIKIELPNGTVVGEGYASDNEDLTKAIEALTPTLKYFKNARFVIEDGNVKDIQKDVEKQFETTYEIPCTAYVKARDLDEALEKLDTQISELNGNLVYDMIYDIAEEDYDDYDDEEDYYDDVDNDYEDEKFDNKCDCNEGCCKRRKREKFDPRHCKILGM
jgi:hypothetical protein